jgi:hypothetical protein
MSSGILYGVSSWMEECRDCGYKGSPVIFDSIEEYVSFLKNLRSSDEGKTQDKKKRDEGTDIREDAKSGGSLEEDVHWHHGKWWLELLIAGLLGILVSFSSIYRNMSIFGVGIGIIYSLLEFVIFFIFILIGIVIIEYLVFLVIKHLKRKEY